ncbi:MAG: type II toxin-antitoxin system RelE/ParE family toxin [Magnetococcales bacterium]|nr:type II toxin-antitoxin system RelE/ParE family toxin [Magnetococcales bacterium]
MFAIRQTDTFSSWLASLRDARGKAAILRRLVRAQGGNLGDTKPVGGDVSELRVDVGPGYRLYFTKRGSLLILLLCVGNKDTQARDIAMARKLSREC